MTRYIQGDDRNQATLFPESLDDYVAEDNPVRVIDVFVDDLDTSGLGFRAQPNDTGRPAYDPRTLLKLYIYGYLNRVHSSRRLEREAQRNIELMWLTGRLAPDFETIADFRKDNGEAIRLVCREFVMLCKKLNLLSAIVYGSSITQTTMSMTALQVSGWPIDISVLNRARKSVVTGARPAPNARSNCNARAETIGA